MKLPLQITYRNLTPSDALDELIRARAAKLETYHRAIMRCHVLVALLHQHHQDGNRVQVRIDLTVPGEEIVVTHEPGHHQELREGESERMSKADELDRTHTHAQVVVREAFDIARRRLQDYTRQHRGDVKTHEERAHGRVVRIGPQEGWLVTADGHEVYFHANAVLDHAFPRLDVGSAVTFVEEKGEKGAQASTVRLLG